MSRVSVSRSSGNFGSDAVQTWSAQKTRVFVSYSRQDNDFVARLVAALEASDDIQVFRDTEDILPSEEWRARLAKLIGEADAIVFCLSPDSAASQVCAWEVETAEALNKRLAPIVVRPVTGPVPGGLAKLNYIFFNEAGSFDRSLDKLIVALSTNISWVREHTRLGELSRHWSASGEASNRLLRGADIAAAEQWAASRPKSAPEPTEMTARFIAASRADETLRERRARRGQIVLGVLAFGLVTGGIGWANQGYLKEQYFRFRYVQPYVLTAAQERALKPLGAPFKECALACPEMVVIPPGKFMMGSPEGEGNDEEHPQHEVTIAYRFAVGRFTVTFDEWDLCVSYGGCNNPAADSGWGRGRQPVTSVSWADAREYVAWLSKITGQSYRLLSEAEWEYAARAGATTVYSFGDAEAELGDYAWYSANANHQTHLVGTKKPNAFGLYDMQGNVWQWVQDGYLDTYKDTPNDGRPVPETASPRRSFRGGSFGHPPTYLRAASRGGFDIGQRGNVLGFRVARTLLPPAP